MTGPLKDGCLKTWLEGSAFVRDGQPVVWCHGTDVEEEFNIFTRWEEGSIGIHFGTHQAAAVRLSGTRFDADDYQGRTIPVYCRAGNPLRLKDHHTWRIDRVAFELRDLGLVSDEVCDHIAEEFDEYVLFAAIEAAGYDCVVYANATERDGEPQDSLMIWRAELVKGVHSEQFEKSDPKIVSQRDTLLQDVQGWAVNREQMQRAEERLTQLRAPSASI